MEKFAKNSSKLIKPGKKCRIIEIDLKNRLKNFLIPKIVRTAGKQSKIFVKLDSNCLDGDTRYQKCLDLTMAFVQLSTQVRPPAVFAIDNLAFFSSPGEYE